METLSAVKLYLILTWAQAEKEEGHWDKSRAGLYYQHELDGLITEAKIEIVNRGCVEQEFQKKYMEIFREAPDGHYIPS